MRLTDASAVLVVDHGSRRQDANEVVREAARALALRLPGLVVRHAHMEIAEPSMETALEALLDEGHSRVVVVPYFLGPGRHATGDLPRIAAEAESRRPGVQVVVRAPFGPDARIVALLEERARDEAAGS